MMVHVLSGQWPFPGEAVRVNPSNPNDVVGVTEFDRREVYINLIGNEHPLMTLIQGCLSNSPSHRPTSTEVHQRVSAVAADHPPSYTNKVEMIDKIKALDEERKRARNERDNAVVEKDAAVAERDRSIDELKETQSNRDSLCQSHSIALAALQIVNADLKTDNEHLQATIIANKRKHKLQQEATQQRCEKQLETVKKEKQALEDEHCSVKQAMEQQHQAHLESKMSELSAKDALISSKTSAIQSLQEKLGQTLGISSGRDNFSIFSPGVKLTFTECKSTPEYIGNLDQGIAIGKYVYVGVGFGRKILKYSITENTWSTLPMAHINYARIGCLYKKVLLIGGRLPSNQVTANIHEFDEASQQWVRSTSIPPMPTARSSVTAVSWPLPPALIICGGNGHQDQPTSVVEVYQSRTSQWHAVSSLPFPRAYATCTVLNNVLYLVGGCEGAESSTCKKTVMSTSIPQVLDACFQPSPIQWQSLAIPNTPRYWSTAGSLGGSLLVVGGATDLTFPPKPKSIVSSVHAYCPFTSSWVRVGELPQPLYGFVAVTLPTGELLVVGGGSPSDGSVKKSNATYKCSLSMFMQ